jgi:hypothetical protein
MFPHLPVEISEFAIVCPKMNNFIMRNVCQITKYKISKLGDCAEPLSSNVGVGGKNDLS